MFFKFTTFQYWSIYINCSEADCFFVLFSFLMFDMKYLKIYLYIYMEVLFILFSDEKSNPYGLLWWCILCTRRADALRYAHEPGILTKETPLISLLYTTQKERNVFYDKHVQMKVVIISWWHLYYTAYFFICQPFFENYFIFFIIVKRLSSDSLFSFLLSFNISWISFGYSFPSSKNSCGVILKYSQM